MVKVIGSAEWYRLEGEEGGRIHFGVLETCHVHFAVKVDIWMLVPSAAVLGEQTKWKLSSFPA